MLNVVVVAGMDCREFSGQRCGVGTRYDINLCVCNHEEIIDRYTCLPTALHHSTSLHSGNSTTA